MKRKSVGTVFQGYILFKYYESGLNKKNFAKKYKVAHTLLTKMLKEDNVNITSEVMDRFLNEDKVDLAYVIKHQGEYYEE